MKDLMDRIGYVFHNVDYLKQALTHRSAGSPHYERLEFLGDALLNAAVAAHLYQAHPTRSEGELTRLRASWVKQDTLIRLAQQWNLEQYLILGAGERYAHTRALYSIQADVVEAILGAVYLDAGSTAVQSCVERWYEALWKGQPPLVKKDAKSRLQEYCQAEKIALPVYNLEQVVGPPHAQHFRVSCTVREIQTLGEGDNRRIAEQNAASAMLRRYDHE